MYTEARMHTRPRTTPRVIGSPKAAMPTREATTGSTEARMEGLSAVAQVAEPLGVEQVGNHRPHHHKSRERRIPMGEWKVVLRSPGLVMNREPMPAMRKV